MINIKKESKNGDFYNNGTTSWSFGGSVGVGKYATLEGGVNGSSEHYVYAYSSGYVKIR